MSFCSAESGPKASVRGARRPARIDAPQGAHYIRSARRTGMQGAPKGLIGALNERSRIIFSEIVNAYLETGEPTGSRTLSRRIVDPLSPATIRNVMADLEELGLLYAPHTRSEEHTSEPP